MKIKCFSVSITRILPVYPAAVLPHRCLKALWLTQHWLLLPVRIPRGFPKDNSQPEAESFLMICRDGSIYFWFSTPPLEWSSIFHLSTMTNTVFSRNAVCGWVCSMCSHCAEQNNQTSVTKAKY